MLGYGQRGVDAEGKEITSPLSGEALMQAYEALKARYQPVMREEGQREKSAEEMRVEDELRAAVQRLPIPSEQGIGNRAEVGSLIEKLIKARQNARFEGVTQGFNDFIQAQPEVQEIQEARRKIQELEQVISDRNASVGPRIVEEYQRIEGVVPGINTHTPFRALGGPWFSSSGRGGMGDASWYGHVNADTKVNEAMSLQIRREFGIQKQSAPGTGGFGSAYKDSDSFAPGDRIGATWRYIRPE